MFKTEVFNINQADEITYLTIEEFEKTNLVNHCFTTRHGGVSQGFYQSMNLGFHNGDDEEKVRKNYELICKVVNINPEHLVLSQQTHKDNIKVIDESHLGNGYTKPNEFNDIDGLVTNVKGVALVTSFADCVPLFFLDPVKGVIALSHAGWRGTVKKVGQKTIATMNETYGCQPDDILVAIGPSIGPCCFEVSEDVKLEVEKSFDNAIIDWLIISKENGKYMIDLWQANYLALQEVGIREGNIIMTDICTMCHKEDFHSHRGSKGKRGNLAAIMELKPN